MIAFTYYTSWLYVVARSGWITFRLPRCGEICYDYHIALQLLPTVAFVAAVFVLICPPNALGSRRNDRQPKRVK